MNHDLAVQHRLAVYGTLAPGRPNEHVLVEVPGDWSPGTVRGQLHEAGWGAASGYPGIIVADDAPEVEVHLFTSPELPQHWARLDDFEGPGYTRTAVTVTTPDGSVEAYIYALAEGPISRT